MRHPAMLQAEDASPAGQHRIKVRRLTSGTELIHSKDTQPASGPRRQTPLSAQGSAEHSKDAIAATAK